MTESQERLRIAREIIASHYPDKEDAPKGLLVTVWRALGKAELRGFDECLKIFQGGGSKDHFLDAAVRLERLRCAAIAKPVPINYADAETTDIEKQAYDIRNVIYRSIIVALPDGPGPWDVAVYEGSEIWTSPHSSPMQRRLGADQFEPIIDMDSEGLIEPDN